MLDPYRNLTATGHSGQERSDVVRYDFGLERDRTLQTQPSSVLGRTMKRKG